jgi:hypothetical protein
MRALKPKSSLSPQTFNRPTWAVIGAGLLACMALVAFGFSRRAAPSRTGNISEPMAQSTNLDVKAVPPVTTSESNQTLPQSPEPEWLERGWMPVSGVWQFISSAAKASIITQEMSAGYDHLLLAPKIFKAPFVLRSRFHHLIGSGAGLAFGASEHGTHRDTHQVRYSDDGAAIVWGYFDQNDQFVTQGSKGVPPPLTDSHELELDVGNTYSIKLDGQVIAKDQALHSSVGRVGLQASVSTAQFDRFEVDHCQAETCTRWSGLEMDNANEQVIESPKR